MKLLPPPGPERNRLLMMIVLLVVIGAAYAKWGGSPPLEIPATTGPAPTSNPVAPAVQAPPRAPGPGRASGTPATTVAQADAGLPQPLKYDELEQIPDEPEAGSRNPFRFGVPPPAPMPPIVAPPPPPPPPPPRPQGPPPIPLKLTLVIQDPYEPSRNRAYLADKNGFVFEALEGEIVDGQYKLLKVGTSSVVMSYLDGSGQRTIQRGG